MGKGAVSSQAPGQGFEEQVAFSLELLQNLPQYYSAADLVAKQQLIGSIFLEKMVFENRALQTKKVNEAVALLCRVGKGLRESEDKKSSESSELSTVVPRTGIFKS